MLLAVPAGRRALVALGLCHMLLLPCRAAHAEERPWWERAVFYEIYTRSFMDTNGDGVGDLNGITAKLDYLAELGIDAIWITPFYPSPQVDFGYDVSDYENVDPLFGTLADFDRLLAEAHRRKIRVVTDLVLNHTSDQHPFFVESRSSRKSAKRDWYVWRNGIKGGPPNNWYSGFGPSAWTLDQRTGQYYYHYFYPQQPDLNWRNPAVEATMFKAARFWLERGVDGFRLDAVNWLFEDKRLRDNPVLATIREGSATEQEQELTHNRDQPETHAVLRRLRALCDGYGKDRLLIGEAWVPTLEQLAQYYGPKDDELQLPFNFFFTQVPKLDAPAFRAEVAKAEAILGRRPTTYVLSNHDLKRAYDRYGDGKNNDRIAMLLATMLLTLRGAPFIYYGEEIGMATAEPASLDEVRDPVGRLYWPGNKGRDGERTPMQWDGTPGAGFTTGKPWLPLPPEAATRNRAALAADGASILNFYRRALQLRRKSPALLEGDYAPLGDDPDVFAYRRRSAEQTMLIVLNMSAKARTYDLPPDEVRPRTEISLFNTTLNEALSLTPMPPDGAWRGTLALPPYAAVVLKPVKQ
jgi:alpha-glucosidase